mgnify:FL=1
MNKCSDCGAILSPDELAKLKVLKQVECEHCGNIIQLTEDNEIMDQFKCAICGGPILLSNPTQKKFTCDYCFTNLNEIEFKKSDYKNIWRQMKRIPQSKINQASTMLYKAMDSEQFKHLTPEQQKIIKENSYGIMDNAKDIMDANKWTFAKSAIKYVGAGLGALIGISTLGGVVGSAVGFLVSLVGPIVVGKKN